MPVAATIPTVPAIRAGTSTTGTPALTRTITFSSPMPSTSYAVALTGSTGIAALAYTVGNKTVNGFVITFSLSTSASVDYTAIAF